MKSLVAFVALTAIVAGAASAQPGNNGAKVAKRGFLLNVIALSRCPEGDFVGSNRRMIAVEADFTGVATDRTAHVNKIFLRSGGGFSVEDGNACDQSGAYFELPVTAANCKNCGDPAIPAPTFSEYEVRARVLGKPKGGVTVTSCVDASIGDSLTGLVTPAALCSVGEENLWVGARDAGGIAQSRWENVSEQLLTVCIDTGGDGVCDDRIGLFDSAGEGYWWNWDTKGRPHVQLVFVPVTSGDVILR